MSVMVKSVMGQTDGEGNKTTKCKNRAVVISLTMCGGGIGFEIVGLAVRIQPPNA
jgi:hypothetical protein